MVTARKNRSQHRSVYILPENKVWNLKVTPGRVVLLVLYGVVAYYAFNTPVHWWFRDIPILAPPSYCPQ